LLLAAIQAPLCFVLSQLVGVIRFLVFERHCMDHAFDITSRSRARRFFRQVRERARPRHDYVNQVAAHGAGNPPKGAKRDAVFGFGVFKLLDGLPGCAHFLADLALTKGKRLARRGEPPA
jgi:hypothetical protein